MKVRLLTSVFSVIAFFSMVVGVQGGTLLWSYDFENLNYAVLTGQDGWGKIQTGTGWEDAYVVSGAGGGGGGGGSEPDADFLAFASNTSKVMGRQNTPSAKGASAYRLFETPFYFNPGESVDFYFHAKGLKANINIGIRWEGQANNLFCLGGVEFQNEYPTHPLKAYLRSNSGTEYRGSNLVADNWYEFRLTYDFSVSGGQGTLAYRNLTLDETTFTVDSALTNIPLAIPQVSGQYKAVGLNARLDLAQLPGSPAWPCSLMVDNIAFGAPIPEPSTLALLGCGLVSLLAYAWRKRR